MTDLIVLGASGLAREVLAVVRETRSHRPVGVLDDAPHARDEQFAGIPVLGPIADLGAYYDTEVIVCVGSGQAREQIVQRIARSGVRGTRFATIVDPGVRNPGRSPIGVGSIVLGSATITADAVIGDHVVIMPGVTVTHDDEVGSFATLAAGVSLGGSVRVGHAAYIGMNAAVFPGVRVGHRSVVGMGAAVLSDVPDGEVWAGVPARQLSRQPADHSYQEALR